MQSTNPAAVAPEQGLVKQGFAREDLFVCVHEQLMTETAKLADIVLPATMFMEHDDLYQGGGHQYIMFGRKLVDPPGECRSNHEVVSAIAERVGADHRGFAMTPREIIDWTLRESGWGTLEDLEAASGSTAQPSFEQAHYLGGFAWPDRKFRFKPDGRRCPSPTTAPWARSPRCRRLPDHWAVIEEATPEHPFRLATSPARNFLNTTFNETPTSLANEKRPTVMIHPADAAELGIADGEVVTLENHRGAVRIAARHFDGVRRGVLIAEFDLARQRLSGRQGHQPPHRGGRRRTFRRRGFS